MTKINNNLIEFEKIFDESVANMKLLSFPLRTVLTGLWGITDKLLHERNFGRHPVAVQPHTGAILVSRFSYLTKQLLNCPLEPQGTDALNAYSPFQDDPTLLAELVLLVQYGHFCEIMPEFYRNYYTANGDRTTGFVLQHSNQNVSKFERKDIVLSEIAMPFGINAPPIPRRIITRIVNSKDMGLFATVVQQRYLEVRELIVEYPILTDAGYQASLGVSFQEFRNYRAACFAIADCCLALTNEYATRLKNNTLNSADWQEFLEWTNVCIDGYFVQGMISAFTGLSSCKVEKITKLFAVGNSVERPNAAADGFFPPFWWLSEPSMMFNPDILKLMLSSRNIPFALNRLDPTTFHEKVSHHLEPALIAETLETLVGFNIDIVEGAIWELGEFDLLLFEEQTNTAVHFQAKGAIPAQGARMVGAVEKRSQEGLNQLSVFRNLSGDDKDRILAKVLNRKVKNVVVVDVLLTRSGIGSWKIWEKLGSVIPTNPALIKTALRRKPSTLNELILSLPNVLDEIVSAASISWVQTYTTFLDVQFEIPLLDMNNSYLEQLRIELANINTYSLAKDAAKRWAILEDKLGSSKIHKSPTKRAVKRNRKKPRKK